MQEWLSGICPVMRDDVNLSRLSERCGEGGGGRLGINLARITGCVCPKVKDMGLFLASSE